MILKEFLYAVPLFI